MSIENFEINLFIRYCMTFQQRIERCVDYIFKSNPPEFSTRPEEEFFRKISKITLQCFSYNSSLFEEIK